MNKLKSALQNETNYSLTDNGALTHKSSLNDNLDFFYIGPVAKKNPADAVKTFQKAYVEDRELGLRVLQWVRDARGGAGARQAFRDCFAWLMDRAPQDAIAVLNKLPEIGRWDDVLVALFASHAEVQKHAIDMIRKALLVDKDALCAKWMPRKDKKNAKAKVALAIRRQLKLSAKDYRKLLVELSDTVEQKLCAQDFNDINYSHVPSVAFARYRDTFQRHDLKRYNKFVEAAAKGEVKVNASAIYPHDIVKGLLRSRNVSLTDRHAINAQWKNLPDYLEGDDTGLVIADTSGSMTSVVAGSSTALDVCIALAMYMAERARGPFKDTFLTFSSSPQFWTLKGDIVDRYNQMKGCNDWEGSTNLTAAFDLILRTAVKHKVAQADMPKFVTIVSDMEFNYCVQGTALDMIRSKYRQAGYELPQVVFWNVNGRVGNVPAKGTDKGIALVAGYSPAAVMKVFSCSTLTPTQVMLDTVMVPRYDLDLV